MKIVVLFSNLLLSHSLCGFVLHRFSHAYGDMWLVLKYVPYVGDSKRAMDEYTSEIFMGGTNTIVLHNTCEDSLLAAPIILDLVLLAELSSRIQLKAEGEVCLSINVS